MPNYQYFCKNAECKAQNKVVIVSKKMSESDRVELCKECNQPLARTIESLVCGYVNDSEFFGKVGQHD